MSIDIHDGRTNGLYNTITKCWRVKSDGSSLKQIYTGNPQNLQLINQKLSCFAQSFPYWCYYNYTGHFRNTT